MQISDGRCPFYPYLMHIVLLVTNLSFYLVLFEQHFPNLSLFHLFQTYSIWASSCKNKTECNEMHPYISGLQVNTVGGQTLLTIGLKAMLTVIFAIHLIQFSLFVK